MTSKKNITLELSILFIILIISFLFWDTYLLFPLKLSIVLLHELSHGITAIVTGGKIIGINLGLDLSGKCEIDGGSSILISASGYLGSFTAGAMFVYATHNRIIGKWLLIITASTIFFLSVLYLKGGLMVFLSVLFSSFIFLSSFYLSNKIISFIIKVFGFLSCVYVLFDIKEDILTRTAAFSDASILSDQLNISALIIGITWLIISLGGIILLLKICYFQKSK